MSKNTVNLQYHRTLDAVMVLRNKDLQLITEAQPRLQGTVVVVVAVVVVVVVSSQ